MRRPPAFLAYLCLVICLTIWGGTSVVSKVTVEQFPVFSTLFLRFCLASLCLIPFLIKDNQRRSVKRIAVEKQWQLILLAFIGITIQIGFFFLGIADASVLDASIIIALGPMLICVAGWIFLKERWNILNVIGLVIATIGVIAAFSTNGGQSHHSLIGNTLIFLSTIAIVAYAIGSKKLNHDFSPIAITTVSFMVGMISFIPLAAWEYWQHPNLIGQFNSQVGWGIVYLAVASSVIAYWMYEWALKFTTAHKVGVLSFIQPLAGIVLAIIFLGEKIQPAFVVGGLLTAIGVWLAIRQPGGRTVRRSTPARQQLHAAHPKRQ